MVCRHVCSRPKPKCASLYLQAYSTALRGPRGTLFALHVHLRYRETPEGGWVPEALFVVSRAVISLLPLQHSTLTSTLCAPGVEQFASGVNLHGVELRVQGSGTLFAFHVHLRYRETPEGGVGPRGAIRRVARGDSQTLGFVDAGYFFRAE